MANEKRYSTTVIEETFYIPTLGDDGKIRSIPKVSKSYLPPTHAYVLNGLIPVITKGDTKIRYEPADKETRLRLIRETDLPIIQQEITNPPVIEIKIN